MFAVAALAATACGDDDDDTTSDSVATGTEAPDVTGASDNTEASADTDATESTEATEDTGAADGTEPDTTEVDGASAERALPPGERHVEEDEGEPVHGGDLVYGIEADTANPWAPFRVSGATAAYVLLASVTDPLFTVAEDAEPIPYLVESYEANADSTEWTLTVRDGIKFHDGTPLDGAAVEFNIESCQYAPLTATALSWIKEVTSEGQTVTITTNGPYVAMPRNFNERQCAYMFSPKWLGSLADVPQRTEGLPIYDAELAATPANGDPAKPVGAGAFVFESYTPGNGNSYKAVRNEDYWRGPNGVTGEELPYLDSIEGVVAVDIDSRANSLRSGQFDIIHTANADAINQFIEDDEFETIATSLFGDTVYIMLNVAEGDADPEGANAKSPLLNVHCRRALAHAVDVDRLIEEREAGLSMKANGPFGPGQLGYLEDSGYPEYDLDLAAEEFDTCLSELGTEGIEFTFNTTNDPFNVETVQLVVAMWQEAFGNAIQATTTPIEQGQYIGLALNGTFNAFTWRSHGGVDPATQSYWWHSASASPIGSIALNFNRLKDPKIDAALETLQTESDPATRKEAAEEVNRVFGEQVYNIWTTRALWGIIEQPYVNGTESNTVPGESDGVGVAFAGLHRTNQMWCNEGTCE